MSCNAYWLMTSLAPHELFNNVKVDSLKSLLATPRKQLTADSVGYDAPLLPDFVLAFLHLTSRIIHIDCVH